MWKDMHDLLLDKEIEAGGEGGYEEKRNARRRMCDGSIGYYLNC